MGKFQELADKAGCTVSQLALAWLLKQGEDVVPIPGTKRVGFLEENWGAQEIVVTDELEREIREFVEGAAIAGDVVPPQFKSYYYGDTVEEK